MRDSTRDFLDEELLEQRTHCTRASTDQRIPDRQLRPLTIARRIVHVRNSRRRQITQHIGVVRLPAPIVSLTDHYARDSMKHPGPDTPRAFVEIAWILVQQRWKNRIGQKCAHKAVCIDSAKAFRVASRALPIPVEVILGLLPARAASPPHGSPPPRYRAACRRLPPRS